MFAGLTLHGGLAAVSFLPAMNLRAQAPAARPLITQAIDENQLFTLPGHVVPAVTAANDQGPVANEFRLRHMLLRLKRPEERQRALDKLLEEQQDKNSSHYHQWLTPPEYGERFGLAPEDIRTIAGWLESRGFKVNSISPNGVMIDFSGTAGDVKAAFHTSIRRLDVNGERHFANASDPQVPAALAPAIAGIVSLNDLRAHPFEKSASPAMSK